MAVSYAPTADPRPAASPLSIPRLVREVAHTLSELPSYVVWPEGRLSASSLSLLPEEVTMHSNSASNGRGALPTKSAVARIWLTFALIISFAFLRGAPAEADQIFAEIYLYNNTSQDIVTPSNGAQTPQLWGTHGNTFDSAGNFVVKLDNSGAPPNCLGPQQTAFWGTKSNGGFLATTGTGGSLAIPAANAAITWSAPWSYFNGVGGGCDGEVVSTGGSAFGSNITVTGGAVGADLSNEYPGAYDRCVFVFTLNQSSNANPGNSTTCSSH
jgi:hypothetical protein